MQNRRLNLGILGYPLFHSLSPRLYQTAMETLGMEGEYHLFPIPPVPEGAEQIQSLLQRVCSGELQGLNVTIPHKQAVIPWLDKLTPTASAIGAVNVLFLNGDRLTGDNTDAPGFSADLRRYIDRPAGSALVLGAGGAARAVVFALAQSGWRVRVCARRAAQAAGLARDLQHAGLHPISAAPLTADVLQEFGDCRLIVNATPVGMTPQIDASPWLEGLPFPAGALVYDLIYKPPETKLMLQARAAGLQAVSGLGMLVEQAVLAFERWTGIRPEGSSMTEGRGSETSSAVFSETITNY
ncbi:MAG: shikimate dehydrogenase [Anaerolineaceae bacterium]|nr:shikimate dehydrogenase [Anaerolineaceae bacterium]